MYAIQGAMIDYYDLTNNTCGQNTQKVNRALYKGCGHFNFSVFKPKSMTLFLHNEQFKMFSIRAFAVKDT